MSTSSIPSAHGLLVTPQEFLLKGRKGSHRLACHGRGFEQEPVDGCCDLAGSGLGARRCNQL